MSEHIVHTGIIEDSLAIVPLLPEIPGAIASALTRHASFAQLGSITVAGDTYSFRLLERFKPQWREKDDLLEAKLAFVVGWVSHRACDRIMKPIWSVIEISGRGSDADPKVSPTECSVYHEAELYRRYYAGNTALSLAIFPDRLAAWPGAASLDTENAMAFAEGSFAMNLMGIQTFPPPPPAQPFMEELCLQAQKFYVDVSRYTRAAGSPDPEKKRRFVTDIAWYDESDAILALAMTLRAGKPPEPAAVRAAVDTPAASYYGKALQLSLRYITATAEYMVRPDADIAELKGRLDIGKLGSNGLPV